MDVRGLAVAHDDTMEITLSNGEAPLRVEDVPLELAERERQRGDVAGLVQPGGQIPGHPGADRGEEGGEFELRFAFRGEAFELLAHSVTIARADESQV